MLSKTPDLAGETERFFFFGGGGGFGYLVGWSVLLGGNALVFCLMRGFLCQVFVNLEVASLFEDNYIHKTFSVKPWHFSSKNVATGSMMVHISGGIVIAHIIVIIFIITLIILKETY